MLGARSIFEVGAGLPRPELSQLLGAETAPLLEKKGGTPNAAWGEKQFAAMKIARFAGSFN